MYLPSRRYTSVIRTSDTILRTSSFSAMNRIFVGIVTAIIVAVAQPIRLHANVGLFAFQMVRGTSRVTGASLVSFVRCNVVFAVIYPIADLKDVKISVIRPY